MLEENITIAFINALSKKGVSEENFMNVTGLILAQLHWIYDRPDLASPDEFIILLWFIEHGFDGIDSVI